MQNIRKPAVAGQFYPADAATLADNVAAMLASAKTVRHVCCPKALIVPHAGYIYSGNAAAAAYARLKPYRNKIRRVILLGPAHRVPVRGLALPDTDAFYTPLGRINLDPDAIACIKDMPQVVTLTTAHATEHSLEVQLPFLQAVLDDFTLVPLAVGDATQQEVTEVLERLWGGPETVVVVSSDLSHFLPYDEARAVDKDTTHCILSLSGLHSHLQACGATPINGLLLAARRHGLQPHLLALYNSGDTTGERTRVVGYGAFAFVENHDERSRY